MIIELQELAVIDKNVMDIAKTGMSDPSEPGSVVVASGSIAPSAPLASVSAETSSVVLTLTKPTTRVDGKPLNNFREFAIYYSTSSTIDITNDATYDGIITSPSTETPFPCTARHYFKVTALDTFDNESAASAECDTTPVHAVAVFYQAAIPTSIGVGDLWIDTDDENKMYRAAIVGADEITAGEWVLIRDTGITNALAAAATALAIADGEIVGFYQDAKPGAAMVFGDIWIDTDGATPLDTTCIYRYEDAAGGSQGALDWRAAATSAIGLVYLTSYTAQATADGKITTFYQDAEPGAGMAEGDFWVDTNDDNKLYTYSGAAWEEVLAAAVIPDQILANLVPNPFFELDSNADGTPDEWTKDAEWVESSDAYYGSKSMKGQGAAKSLYSDKVTLPLSNRSLIVSGMAKTSGTSFAVAEFGTGTPGAAPKAYCDASGDLMAIQRTSGGDEVIELWDVSNPGVPALKGTVADTGNDRTLPFKIYGDYLICGHGDQFLSIYDISDPTAPVEIEVYTMWHATGVLSALAVRDWIVYACCDDSTEGGWIEVIDITTPSTALHQDLIAVAAFALQYADVANDLLAVTLLGGEWVSPTGFSDPGSTWSTEPNAYDGNLSTNTSTSVPANDWSTYLELNIASALCDGIRFYIDYPVDNITLIDIDVYRGGAWVDVYQGAWTEDQWEEKTFTAGVVTKARIRFYNNDSGPRAAYLEEFDFLSAGGMALYDVADPTSVSLEDTYTQDGLKHVVMQGDYAYLTCDSGTDVDKIVILDISVPAVIAAETTIGGAGADDYTGHDALMISQGSLVNVGVGTDAGKYSVSFWEMSTPALPTIEAVGNAIVGDMDAAAAAGGFIFGVDTGNTKIRVVDPSIAADWQLKVRFYTLGDVLIETIVVYDGDGDSPFTGVEWTAFSQAIPQADIPGGASKVDFLCYCNETTGYVYVDNLEAVFDTA